MLLRFSLPHIVTVLADKFDILPIRVESKWYESVAAGNRDGSEYPQYPYLLFYPKEEADKRSRRNLAISSAHIDLPETNYHAVDVNSEVEATDSDITPLGNQPISSDTTQTDDNQADQNESESEDDDDDDDDEKNEQQDKKIEKVQVNTVQKQTENSNPDKHQQRSYPLLIYLHGAGESASGQYKDGSSRDSNNALGILQIGASGTPPMILGGYGKIVEDKEYFDLQQQYQSKSISHIAGKGIQGTGTLLNFNYTELISYQPESVSESESDLHNKFDQDKLSLQQISDIENHNGNGNSQIPHPHRLFQEGRDAIDISDPHPDDILIPKSVITILQNDFYVIAPRTNRGWRGQSINKFINLFMYERGKELKIDRNRIHITGVSMGGAGVWSTVENAEKTVVRVEEKQQLVEQSQQQSSSNSESDSESQSTSQQSESEQPPKQITLPTLSYASATPICPASPGIPPHSYPFSTTALWVFHSANDQVVPIEYSDSAIEGLKHQNYKAGGSDILYSRENKGPAPLGWGEYQGHAGWIAAYVRRPWFWKWMRKQKIVSTVTQTVGEQSSSLSDESNDRSNRQLLNQKSRPGTKVAGPSKNGKISTSGRSSGSKKGKPKSKRDL